MSCMNNMKPYILQDSCSTCRFITLLNASIHWTGLAPVQYGTNEYTEMILTKLGGFVDFERGLSIPDDWVDQKKLDDTMLEIAGIHERKAFSGDGRKFKKWMKDCLNEGMLIDFSAYIRGLHSFLIVEYCFRTDAFKCINAQFFDTKNAVEWLPLEVLYAGHVGAPWKLKDDTGFSKIHSSSSALLHKSR